MLFVQALAPSLEVGDVRLVIVRDVRDHRPVAGEIRPGDLLDPRSLDALDGSELLEVDRRPGCEIEADRGARRRARAGPRSSLMRESFDVLAGDPSLTPAAGRAGQIDAELAGDPANGGAGVDRACPVLWCGVSFCPVLWCGVSFVGRR